MIPINTAERKRSFLNFLLFFIITVAVILVTVFFSVQVPFRENEKLRREKDIAYNERTALRSFEAKMQETMNLVDSINLSNNSFRYGTYIENNLKTMDAMISDSNSAKTMCTKVIDNLTSLQRAYEQIKNSNNSSAELAQKDKQIQELQDETKSYISQINQLNQLLYKR